MKDAVKAFMEEMESAKLAKATCEVKASAQIIKGEVISFQVRSKGRPPARPSHDEKNRHFG
jgi:hypothetical protein